MTSGEGTNAEENEARADVMRLIFGTMAAQAVGAAARLGVLDALGERERTAEELATDCGAEPGSLLRLLRALAGLGLLTEERPGAFRATATGRVLRADHPGSFATVARVFTEPLMVRSWERLADAVRTGEPTFPQVFGRDFFGYLEERPALSAEFNASMSQGSRSTADVLPGAYDFAGRHTVVDVGGGDGTLLASILRAHPGLRGVVHDTPKGLAQARATMERAGVAERFDEAPGDFFASVPTGGDLYLLKSVLHDWNDERCVTLLGNCRAALPPGGRVLVVEPVLPPTVAPELAGFYLSDLNMLVNLGGRERTRDDFESLLTAAGLTLTQLVPLPLPSTFSLIEAAAR
ncbi:helix-turn-helix domain-containing protein [Streptomyces sp. 3MP-14]|uniref:Helix-turn-helix domain-containing protein n=1 Tax=Streptomyces mimosae TaxID=2586635 RepID=A0A5N5ZUJ2_9ACTN|nr:MULTISPECIES: methyltransferase [Streptomyces]KAB8160191.1 helix-turn-helix domain-containing protein [Streptomyces mimosae]KAB8176640.1 helix-turn-helix domain-containing protein [Streptomyces sp. 3MP-14]